MIAKGTTHNNGAKLARYLTTAKEGQRLELAELRGFAADNIHAAFRSVHVMAEGTRCEQPFFHVQVRNPAHDRQLTRDEWMQIADRIEAKLGLAGQPRAVVFNTYLHNEDRHCHIAWSRIDSETLTARHLPFYKERLKEVSRELEIELDLTRVTNERDGPVKAPTRNEFEQARRLGVDIKEVRQNIRDCWDHSDNGRSFEAALADHGFVLAQGDRRAFVVIDHQGGIQALGKRILGVTTGRVRDRFADLTRDELPSVEQARDFIRDASRDRQREPDTLDKLKRELAEVNRLLYGPSRDDLKREIAEVDKLLADTAARQVSREKTKSEPMRDPHRDEIAWQDALAKAAIEKEKIERRFVEPNSGREARGRREKEQGSPSPPEHLKGIAAEIWVAYNKSPDVHEFADRLEPKAHLACVTKEEASRSHREAAFAREIGRSSPTYREGEIVVVTEPSALYRRDGEITERRRVYQLNRYTTGQDRATIEKFLAPLDRKQLQGIDATKEKLNTRAADRSENRGAIRLNNAQRTRDGARIIGKESMIPAAIGKTGERAVSKTLDSITNAIESLFAPVLTPEQKREGEQITRERAADTADKIDLSRYLAEREGDRQRQEREQDAARQRQRDDRERS